MNRHKEETIIADITDAFDERMFLNMGGDFELSDAERKEVEVLVKRIIEGRKGKEEKQ
jgi:hypothetical protein